MSDSITLSSQEYSELHSQQNYYYTVNKDVDARIKQTFYTGYYSGAFLGIMLVVVVYGFGWLFKKLKLYR